MTSPVNTTHWYNHGKATKEINTLTTLLTFNDLLRREMSSSNTAKKFVCFSRNLIHPLLPSFFQGFKSSVCQQCAKITRTAGAYTECCDNVSNAYVWCKRLYDFTNPLGWFDSQRSTKLAKLIYPSVLDNHRSSCTSHFLDRRREKIDLHQKCEN